MVHRFKLLLVTACLSLTTAGLAEVAAAKATARQSSPVKAGVTQFNSPSSPVISSNKANPSQPSSPSLSPASSGLVKSVSESAKSPQEASSKPEAETPLAMTVNQITWLVLALLLGAAAIVVGRNRMRGRSSVANSAQVLLNAESGGLPNVAQADVAQRNITQEEIKTNIAHTGTAQNGVQSGTQSHKTDQDHRQDTYPQEAGLQEIGVSPTTRLAKVDIVETLIGDLHHTDAAKRRKAIWELGQRGDSRAIQPLVDLLLASDSQQRSLILAAVAEISTRTLKPMNRALLMSLQDESADVRKNAIRDITRIYDLMTQVSQLVQYATNDTDEDVQDTARWALSQFNRLRSVPESGSEIESKTNSEYRGLNGRDQQNDSTLPPQ
jgi:hypothetical protein